MVRVVNHTHISGNMLKIMIHFLHMKQLPQSFQLELIKNTKNMKYLQNIIGVVWDMPQYEVTWENVIKGRI